MRVSAAIPSAGAEMCRASWSTWMSPTSARMMSAAAVTSPRPADRDDEAGAPGLVLELERGALGDDPAVVDDDDAVGELVGLVEVLGREEERRAVADEVAQHAPQLDPAAGVEPGRRLVEEEHRRCRDEAGREVEPATHAAGVVLDDLAARLREREPLEQLVARPAHEGPVETVEVADEAEVLSGR